ncbi:MAG: phosphatase PAP2 family protein [archaeon]|nr:phosphatase PAP2 family protein [archaeon]
MNVNKSKYYILIKLLVFIFYFACIFTIEYFSRDVLFNYTIQLQKKWKPKENQTLVTLFFYISELANKRVLYPLYLVVYTLAPLNMGYTIMFISFTCTFAVNALKMIYTAPRAFWVESSIKRGCSCTYGNPSGHCVRAVAAYFSIWHMIKDKNLFQIKDEKRKHIIDKVLFLLITALIVTVNYARIYLDAHTLNQVLFGTAIGFGIYFFYCFVLEIHLKTEKNEFFSFILNSINQAAYGGVFFICFIVSFFVYLLYDPDIEKYEKNMNEMCPNIIKSNCFTDAALADTLSSVFLIGFHYGITLFLYLINHRHPKKEEEVNHLTNTNLVTSVKRFIFAIPFGITVFLTSYLPIVEDTDASVIIIVYNVIPMLFCGFLISFPYLWLCIRLGMCNKHIDEFLPLPIQPEIEMETPTTQPNKVEIY